MVLVWGLVSLWSERGWFGECLVSWCLTGQRRTTPAHAGSSDSQINPGAEHQASARSGQAKQLTHKRQTTTYSAL